MKEEKKRNEREYTTCIILLVVLHYIVLISVETTEIQRSVEDSVIRKQTIMDVQHLQQPTILNKNNNNILLILLIPFNEKPYCSERCFSLIPPLSEALQRKKNVSRYIEPLPLPLSLTDTSSLPRLIVNGNRSSNSAPTDELSSPFRRAPLFETPSCFTTTPAEWACMYTRDQARPRLHICVRKSADKNNLIKKLIGFC